MRQPAAPQTNRLETRNGNPDVTAIRKAVDAVKAQDDALGRQIELAVLAQLTPVQRGQYAAV
jgi:hypothetical protein